MSTLKSMNLILPRHSVLASTGWGCCDISGRRTVAGRDDGNGGPGTTGNIERCGNCRRVLWLRSQLSPSRFRPDSGFRRNLKQNNLALECLNSNMSFAESEVIRRILWITKNEARPDRKTGGIHNLAHLWFAGSGTSARVRKRKGLGG